MAPVPFIVQGRMEDRPVFGWARPDHPTIRCPACYFASSAGVGFLVGSARPRGRLETKESR